MNEKLRSVIDSLSQDQKNIFGEEESRIEILSSLDSVHKELQGEHEKDLKTGEAIDSLKQDALAGIELRKKQIEAEKSRLSELISTIENSLKQIKEEITVEEKETERLQGIVDEPEDLSEVGFSDEAKETRQENEKLREQQDALTNELLSHRDERSDLIEEHNCLVREYNGTVELFNTNLQNVQTQSFQNQSNYNISKLEFARENIRFESDSRKKELSAVTIKALEARLSQMRSDFDSSDSHYKTYINSLRQTGIDHQGKISVLKDQLSKRGYEISDMNQRVEELKFNLEHNSKQMDEIKQIEYQKRATGLQGDLNLAEKARKETQDGLDNGQSKWSFNVNTFEEAHSERQIERDNALAKIQDLLDSLTGLSKDINQLQEEKENLLTKIKSDETLDDTNKALAKELEGVNLKLKWASDERDKLLEDMRDANEMAAMKEQYIRD